MYFALNTFELRCGNKKSLYKSISNTFDIYSGRSWKMFTYNGISYILLIWPVPYLEKISFSIRALRVFPISTSNFLRKLHMEVITGVQR